jgi:hypothetical protein
LAFRSDDLDDDERRMRELVRFHTHARGLPPLRTAARAQVLEKKRQADEKERQHGARC